MKIFRFQKGNELFSGLLFFYFATLHADKLGFTLGGFNIRVNNLLAILLLLLLVIRFRTQAMALDKRWSAALLGILAALALSALFSPYKSRCAVFIGWYGLTLLCYVLFPYLLVKLWDAERVFSLYLASFIAVGLYALGQLLFSLLGWNDPFAQQRIIGNFVRPNAFSYEPSFYALYMTPFILLCNFHYISSPTKPFFFFHSLGFKKIVFLNALFLVSTATTTLFAYGVFVFFLLVFPQFKEMRKRTVQFCLIIAGSLVLIGVCFPKLLKIYLMKFLFQEFHSLASFYERWGGITNALKVFYSSPIFGVGLGGYSPLLADAWLRGEETFIYFFSTVEGTSSLLKAFEPSNVLTEVLASLGIIGMTAFALFVFVFFKQAKRALERFKGDVNREKLLLNLALSAAVMLLVLQINQGVLRTYIWVHLSLAFAYFERHVRGPLKQPIAAQTSPECSREGDCSIGEQEAPHTA